MKKLIFLFITVLFLVSCASTKDATTGKKSHAYDTYKQRKDIVKYNKKIMEQGFVFGACKKKRS